jgi:hypothetical protein
MVRFDVKALHEALDKRRSSRGMTWAKVAAEMGVSATTVTRTRIGGGWRLMACSRWCAGSACPWRHSCVSRPGEWRMRPKKPPT